MKKIIFLFFSIIVPYRGISEIDPKQIISTITGTPEFLKEGMSAIASLGLACGRPDQWGLFVSEINKILLGIAEIISETATQLAFKKDYPTVCHVLTQEQLDLYKDYDDNSKKNKKGVRTKRIDKHLPLYKHYEVLSPHYYWPKYFIEVTEKGYDPHDKFAKENGMFKFNRKIADIYEKIINPQDVLKLIQSVLTGEVLLKGVNAALNALPDKMTGDANIKIGKPKDNFASIIPTLLLSVPLEKYRLIGSKKDSMSTYDASIWPIALSYAMAKNFTVCGPSLKQSGKHPGGSFDALGLAATCPMALSSDAATLWDTGFLDYMDPEAISAMVASSNPATCIADSVRTYFADEEARDTTTTSNPNDPDKKPHNEIPESSMGDGLLKCSYPITGTIESVLKKSIAMTDPKKWKQAKCTVWGPLAPRASFSVQDTDYSYANTAFKFKLFAHELFGVKRGEAEKWSLAYPWEGDGRDENLGEIPSEVTKNMPIDKLEKTTKIASKLSDGVLSKISKQETKKENNSRSHSLTDVCKRSSKNRIT